MIRIVCLTIKSGKVESFRKVMEKYLPNFHDVPGCLYLEILEDIYRENIFYTYSHWKDQMALDTYKNSEIFKKVWQQVKPWFAEKAKASSTFCIMATND